MVTSTESTRSKILDAAIDLFATKGYDSTSVADIQLACGLTAGSGALYKHFPSKQALLEEVIRMHVADITATRVAITAEMLDGLDADLANLEAIVRVGAQLIWQSLERNRAVIRLTLRDLDRHPDLVRQVWDTAFNDVYRQTAETMQSVLSSAGMQVADPEATAAVLMASLTFLPILDGLIGRTPGDVDPERYLNAWVDHAVRTVTAGRERAGERGRKR